MRQMTTFHYTAAKYAALVLVAVMLVTFGFGQGTVGAQHDNGVPHRVIVAQSQDINSFDIARITGAVGLNVFTHAAEALVMVDLRDEATGIIPWLAESWEMIDETTWQFQLREDVKFHNGEPLTAEAVVYSLERYRDPNIPNLTHAYYWDVGLMESVEAVDEHTVLIKTSAPSPTLLAVLSQMYIVEPEWTETAGLDATNRHVVGTGPYKPVEWVKDDYVLMEAFHDYWYGVPMAEELMFRVVPEVGTRVAELQAGGVHIALVTLDQVDRLETDHTRASINPGSRVIHMGLISDDPNLPTGNKLVRQAMNYAVDVEAITESLFHGHTEPYAGVLPGGLTDPAVQPYPYDPAKARQLLAEAGYPNGFDLIIDSNPERLEVAQVVSMYLNQVGIRARVEPHEAAIYSQRLRDKTNNPAYILGQGAFPSAYEQLSTIFDARHGGGAAHNYNDPTFYALMDEALVTIDEDDHLDLLFQAQRQLWEDAPAIFLYTEPVALGMSRSIPNLEAYFRDSIRLHWALTEPREQ